MPGTPTPAALQPEPRDLCISGSAHVQPWGSLRPGLRAADCGCLDATYWLPLGGCVCVEYPLAGEQHECASVSRWLS